MILISFLDRWLVKLCVTPFDYDFVPFFTSGRGRYSMCNLVFPIFPIDQRPSAVRVHVLTAHHHRRRRFSLSIFSPVATKGTVA